MGEETWIGVGSCVMYVDHCSFLLDLKIMFMTIKKVFVREGISSDTSVTMEAFTGNN